MGSHEKHWKKKITNGKHAKAASSNENLLKRFGIIGAGIIATPVAIVSTSGSAHAATMSQWNATAQLESGGDWSINYSSDGMSVGGLQFQNASWKAALQYLNSHGYNTSAWTQTLYQGMPRSTVPTKDQTILAGEALLHIQGPGAWANGNASGARSMFDGGPNPWGLPGTQVPASLGGAPAPAPKPVTPSPTTWNGHYTVVKGDSLSKIARAKNITGGWQVLYAHNKAVVGPNPNLIHPGDRLSVPGTATPAPAPKPTPAPPAPSSKAAAAIAWAKTQLGKPYAFGGTGPYSYDCSGLTMEAYAHAGVSIPRDTYGQITLPRVTLATAKPGDLILWYFTVGSNQPSPNHVSMYLGNGQQIEASTSQGGVAITNVATRQHSGTIVAVVRPTP